MTSNGSLVAVSAVHSKVWFYCRKFNIFVVGIACGDFVLSPYFVQYVVICVLSSFGWRRNLHFVLDWINLLLVSLSCKPKVGPWTSIGAFPDYIKAFSCM